MAPPVPGAVDPAQAQAAQQQYQQRQKVANQYPDAGAQQRATQAKYDQTGIWDSFADLAYDPQNPQGQAQSQQQQTTGGGASPSPTQSAGGGTGLGPYSGGTSLTTPTQDPSAGTGVSGQATDQFRSMVRGILQQKLGSRYYLISDDQYNALADKLWNSEAVQAAYGLVQTNPLYMSTFVSSINNEILNPSDDPTILNDYVNLKQSAGEALTTQELAALSNATQAAGAGVPNPFGQPTRISGYDFGAPMPAGGWSPKTPGQSYGWTTHNGIDYGTPAGSRIVSPFAGTIISQTNVPGYGNYVQVRLDNGWVIGFGHVAQITAANGTRVNPGDLIAISGANVGSAVGAVTIVTWQDPKGNYVNPHQVMDPIFGGATFNSLGAPGAAGLGTPSVNTALDREYPSVKSDWLTYFGSPPSPEDVLNVIAHGSSPAQWSDYIRSLPSHISGMQVGNAYDLRQLADGVSQKMYGHLATDGIVRELFQNGYTNPKDVTYFYDMMPGKELDRPTYTAAANAAKSVTTNIFNEPGVDPRHVSEIVRGAPVPI